jgi:hypothetical protein
MHSNYLHPQDPPTDSLNSKPSFQTVLLRWRRYRQKEDTPSSYRSTMLSVQSPRSRNLLYVYTPCATDKQYSSTGAVWSPQWSNTGTSDLILESGDKATVTYNGTGNYVSLEGGTTAQILRSDIALENGVMHVCHPLQDRA